MDALMAQTTLDFDECKEFVGRMKAKETCRRYIKKIGKLKGYIDCMQLFHKVTAGDTQHILDLLLAWRSNANNVYSMIEMLLQRQHQYSVYTRQQKQQHILLQLFKLKKEQDAIEIEIENIREQVMDAISEQIISKEQECNSIMNSIGVEGRDEGIWTRCANDRFMSRWGRATKQISPSMKLKMQKTLEKICDEVERYSDVT